MNIARNKELPVKVRFQKLVNIGLEELGLELGIISRVVDNSYTVIYSNNKELIGQQFELGNTYCQITLEATDNRLMNVIAFENFGQSDYASHPAYDAFNLNTYIGSPTLVLNTSYGTLNFTKSEIRDADFTIEEKQLVEWLSTAVSYILHQQTQTGHLN